MPALPPPYGGCAYPATYGWLDHAPESPVPSSAAVQESAGHDPPWEGRVCGQLGDQPYGIRRVVGPRELPAHRAQTPSLPRPLRAPDPALAPGVSPEPPIHEQGPPFDPDDI